MELRVLRYFTTMAQEGNISRAAEILHITQPTLSRQLMDLEKELESKLFIRGKKEITLTEEGMLLYQRAQEILELSERTKQELVHRNESISGLVSVGCVEGMGTRVLADMLRNFADKYPKVQFDLYNGYPQLTRAHTVRTGLFQCPAVLLFAPCTSSTRRSSALQDTETTAA